MLAKISGSHLQFVPIRGLKLLFARPFPPGQGEHVSLFFAQRAVVFLSDDLFAYPTPVGAGRCHFTCHPSLQVFLLSDHSFGAECLRQSVMTGSSPGFSNAYPLRSSIFGWGPQTLYLMLFNTTELSPPPADYPLLVNKSYFPLSSLRPTAKDDWPRGLRSHPPLFVPFKRVSCSPTLRSSSYLLLLQ